MMERKREKERTKREKVPRQDMVLVPVCDIHRCIYIFYDDDNQVEGITDALSHSYGCSLCALVWKTHTQIMHRTMLSHVDVNANTGK